MDQVEAASQIYLRILPTATYDFYHNIEGCAILRDIIDVTAAQLYCKYGPLNGPQKYSLWDASVYMHSTSHP